MPTEHSISLVTQMAKIRSLVNSSGYTVITTILLLPGREKRIGAPNQTAANAARLVRVAIATKAGKVVLANSAANSKAAMNTRNRPTAMHATGSSKSRIQPR
jgi:hypothetical protein